MVGSGFGDSKKKDGDGSLTCHDQFLDLGSDVRVLHVLL